MTCAEVRDRLDTAAGGDPDEWAAALRDHVATCDSCRAAHELAVTLPGRLRALGAPAPPPALVGDVMALVAAERTRPLEVWGLAAAELFLLGLAGWAAAGAGGLAGIAQHSWGDVIAILNWGAGQGDFPAQTAGDGFPLLIALALAIVSTWHLSLLARRRAEAG